MKREDIIEGMARAMWYKDNPRRDWQDCASYKEKISYREKANFALTWLESQGLVQADD